MKLHRRSFLAVVLVLVSSSFARADWVVAPGYDLLTTVHAEFLGVEFEGIQLPGFDFAPPNVTQFNGPIDTIIRRPVPISVAEVPGSSSGLIPIELVALSLRSVDDSAFGEVVEVVSLVDTGSLIDVTFDGADGGTFTSELHFDFQLAGVDTNTVFFDGHLDLTQTAATWGRIPPGGFSDPIEGVNKFLNGPGDITHDFFTGVADHLAPGHRHTTITNPEPSSLALLVFGGVAVFLFQRRRNKKLATDTPS